MSLGVPGITLDMDHPKRPATNCLVSWTSRASIGNGMKLDPLNFQTKCSFRVKTRENLAAFEKRSRSQGSNSGEMFLVLEEVLKIWILLFWKKKGTLLGFFHGLFVFKFSKFL